MTATESIDTVLKYYYDNPGEWEVPEMNKKIPNMQRAEFVSIIDKLKKDGFLIFLSQGVFQISFEGKLFYESGGYKEKHGRDTAELEFIKNDRSSRIGREKHLMYG